MTESETQGRAAAVILTAVQKCAEHGVAPDLLVSALLGVALDVGQAWLGNEALAGLLREMADGLENVAVN